MPTVEIISPVLPTVTVCHPESLGIAGAGQLSGFASAAWPGSSRALYFPLRLPRPISVNRMLTGNGASAANSIDVGLYTEDARRLVSSGLVAQATSNDIQIFTLTSTITVGPGVFYLAISMNGTSGTFFSNATPINTLKAAGAAQQDLSAEATPGTLPALATFATISSAYVPAVGLIRTGFTV